MPLPRREVLNFREVPVNPEKIGHTARETLPHIRQAFFDGSAFDSDSAFDIKLYVVRRLLEKGLQGPLCLQLQPP
jgi:Glutamate synthase domain 1